MRKLGKILGFFAVWQVIVMLFKIPSYLIPRPSNIFKELWENRLIFSQHLLYTLTEAIIGIILAIIVSLLIVYICVLYPRFKKGLLTFLSTWQTIPIIVIAPIFLIWFGFGMFSKILLIVLMCIYPIIVNILKGFEEVDAEQLSFFKVIKASERDTYVHLMIPSAVPYFFAGLKIAGTYCVSGALLAEYVGANAGLGIYLSRSLTNYNYEMIFAIVIVVSALTILLLKIIDIIEIKTLNKLGVYNEKVN